MILYIRKEEHWNYIFNNIDIKLPYGRSMICAIRVSKKMMDCIDDYVIKYKRLFMDESLFNTLAIHNKLKIITPVELKNILWRHTWEKEDIINTNLYHPIKDMNIQYEYRNNM